MATSLDLTASKLSSSVILDTRRTRPRFFDGKFLTAADLMQEQSYLLTRQADIARTLGFGVVSGLRVTKSAVSASNLPNPAASVKITAGHGLTPAGEIVFLPKDLIVDLDDIAQMQRLNAAFGLSREPHQPFVNLSGLFVIGLRTLEFTANPTPAYPPSVDGNSALRDGEIIEATALTLVPYESEASLKNPNSARIRAAREIFLEQKPPQLPAGVLPLALLYVRNSQLAWTDEWLVRREAGDDDRFGFGFAPRALSEAHFYHYQEVLKTRPTANDGQLSAKNFLEILPPCGPLPLSVLSQTDFTQAYFPAEARVELALVPEDEISALMEDAIDLPPIDLSLKPEDQDALAILVLAPIPRADYGNTLATLTRIPQPTLRNLTPQLISQQKPITALLKLNANFELRKSMNGGATAPIPAAAAPNFVDPAWRDALKKITSLWYIRRRNFPSAKVLAGTPLPAATATIPTSDRTSPAIVEVISDRITERDGDILPRRVTADTAEAKLAKALEAEGLWGRFAFLRAISDAPTHGALVKLLSNSVILKSPILQQAVFTFIEKQLPAISESPEENFEQIQKESDIKVLNPEILAKTEKLLARSDILRGLEAAFKNHPKLLTEKRTRFVLGRTHRLLELAQIGLKHTEHADFKKLMETVEKHASTGRAQAVADAVDKFLKKANG